MCTTQVIARSRISVRHMNAISLALIDAPFMNVTTSCETLRHEAKQSGK